jgi:Peptidase family M28
MRRREFLVAAASAVAAGASGRPDVLLARDGILSPIALERRLADVIAAYDAQGNHRTGTPVDDASGEWLARQLQEIGAKAELEPFPLSRVDPKSCYLRIADRRIEGVPLFDAAFTEGDGVRGKLGPLGSDAEIGLAETEPFSLLEPRSAQAGVVAQVRRSRHKAVVLLTAGTRPGLFLLNAVSFRKPSGPPTLQVSSVESEWLKHQAQEHAEVTLVAHVGRTPAQAYNVTTKVIGSDPALAPVVLIAPRSAWWQSASEQGSRIACWLEALRVMAAGNVKRDAYFVALSGHELGLLGIDAYMERRPDLVKRAHVWVFYGSDLGAPRQPNLVHASSEALERWLLRAMEQESLSVDAKVRHDAAARGEAGPVQREGGRFVTVACGSEAFHSVADRWPEAIDVGLLARYARALANGALEFAQQAG